MSQLSYRHSIGYKSITCDKRKDSRCAAMGVWVEYIGARKRDPEQDARRSPCEMNVHNGCMKLQLIEFRQPFLPMMGAISMLDEWFTLRQKSC